MAVRVAEYGEPTLPSGKDVVVTPPGVSDPPPPELLPPQAANCRQAAKMQSEESNKRARFIENGFLMRMAGANFESANP